MAVNKKSLENLRKGNQFSSENQPYNPGRRPNVFSKYIRENRLSLDDLRALISSVLSYDPDDIDVFLKDKKNKPPVAMILFLKAIKADMDKGRLDNWVILSDRSYGKPTQNVDLNATGTLTAVTMSPEDRRKRIEELLKKSEPQPEKPGRKRTGRTSKPARTGRA
jgi:hypothetical protein